MVWALLQPVRQMTLPNQTYAEIPFDSMTISFVKFGRRHYGGTILVDPTNSLEDGEWAYQCGHHHHSKGSAKDCAKNTRGWIRRVLKANPETLLRLAYVPCPDCKRISPDETEMCPKHWAELELDLEKIARGEL